MFFCNLGLSQDLSGNNNKFEKQIKLYERLEKNSNNLVNINFYKDKIYKNEINLEDLDKDKISLFLIYKAQGLSDTMYIVQVSWDNELSKIKNEEEKKNFYALCCKLFELRKKHALEFEKIIQINFIDIKSIKDEEKQVFIEKVKKWHEDQKLINRVVK